MNSRFSFFWTGCLIKAEVFSLPFYLLIDGEEEINLCVSPGHKHNVKRKQLCPGFELVPDLISNNDKRYATSAST